MEAFILGSGGSMPLPHRHLTSMLLRREGDLFLFDAGEGTQVSLRKLNLRWKKINAILISHTHADHVTGLPGMLMLSSQVDREEPLYVIGPPRIREYVEASRRILEMYINYEIRVIEIQDPSVPQVVFSGEDYHIRSFPLKHTRVCVGYSFTEMPRPGIFHPEQALSLGVPRGPLWSSLQRGEDVELDDGRTVTPDQVLGSPRSGRKVSYVTDTSFIPSIIDEVRDSDLLVCEGMFETALAETAARKRHMTAREAGIIAREADVKQAGLIHFSPRYTEKDLKLLLKEAREEFKSMVLTRDRQQFTIPYEES
ncbi:Ribonuclease Z [Salinispira pacifica]|uniref:Ribonuclease Z n=2 Tax=Salinispira pacifica TaxID=1307761 RepID=V5WGR2_9SPIO|nr:Ribonuclease Z [Salinispira pacifica]